MNADRQQKVDVYIEDGIIQFVAPNLKVGALRHYPFRYPIWVQNLVIVTYRI